MTGIGIVFRGTEDLAKFILQNYSGRIVEVGAGHMSALASRLMAGDPDLDLVATDIEARDIGGIVVLADDIFSPCKEIYKGASLLYSIRPPLEIQVAMGELARELDADVLIRPLGNEIADLRGFSRTLMNRGDARFYLFKLQA